MCFIGVGCLDVFVPGSWVFVIYLLFFFNAKAERLLFPVKKNGLLFRSVMDSVCWGIDVASDLAIQSNKGPKTQARDFCKWTPPPGTMKINVGASVSLEVRMSLEG